MQNLEQIPEPRGLPFLGNITEFTTSPLNDLGRLADQYGSIYRIRLMGQSLIFCSSNALVNELCDEKRFKKTLKTLLSIVREGVYDGLFTASEDEPNWGKAHRILIPAFGPLSIRGMFPDMHDIATQLALKFARHGSHTPIHAADDFTRLALDTLALCAMDFRFNSFYRRDMHPFVAAMTDFLSECTARQQRPPVAPEWLYRKANEKFAADIAAMKETADEVVALRKANPRGRKDLLAAMLEGVDPLTGERLSDENITYQLTTFLIAGHETTSGLLSFCFYLLLTHPNEYQKIQDEVDQVVGREPITVDHLTKFPRMNAVIREALRLHATIGAFGVEAYEDTIVAGKYLVKKGEVISALLGKAHVDPEVFGADAHEFKPDRMTDENFARLNERFPNCWKPFGNGKRSCIGRPFVMQEVLLAMAMLFQNFTFTMDDPDYELVIKETITIKPDNFYMRAELRHGMTPSELERRLAGKAAGWDNKSTAEKDGDETSPGKPMAVFYGSNSGTCEALAQRLAADAPSHGFTATVASLDDATENLLKDRPVVVVTASYEGQPAGNAARFVKWLEKIQGSETAGVDYAVFGCGHHDWTQTFYRIPKLVDAALEECGGKRLVAMGRADAAESDMFSDFEAWEDELLWPALASKYGANLSDDSPKSGLSIQVSTPRRTTLRQDVEEALVLSTRTLTASGPPKMHMEVQLPAGMTYRAGDYLAVLPVNPRATVSRVFRRFDMAWDAALKIRSDGPTTLPTGGDVSAWDVFSAYVELSQVATKRNILALVEATQDKSTVKNLEELAGDKYQDEIAAKRVSVLELLERFQAVKLSIGSYLAMLPPMRVRQYSISSSPLADPRKATLTYSLLNTPSHSGHALHIGVATTFLSSLSPGDKLSVAVRPSPTSFHLPSTPSSTPIILIAAGTGLAPFRGFIQERAALLAAGRSLAPALLFYGCRDPAVDDLYANELAAWQEDGAIDVRRAYSRASHLSEGCARVQDRLVHDRADIFPLWDQGAKAFICGSREVGKAVEEVCVRLTREWSRENLGRDVGEEEARAWVEEKRNERFATDVFD